MSKISISEILKWYEQNARKLPWRKSNMSAYEVWVSEIMLQQTQVSRVILYYERFLKKFPTVQKLSRASWEEFLPYYEGLGYYARGRNMLEAAKIVVLDFGGEFPKNKNVLMKLPGIGEYTASAILSFAYHKPVIAYDTNFRKIFGTRKKAEAAFQKSSVGSTVFNSAVMDYASAHRLARRNLDIVINVKVSLCQTSIVVLHESHKKYFSENKKKYAPFVMPKGVVTREHIKKYFLEKYDLRVSVRPPNKKGVINAQILIGNHTFKSFSNAYCNLIIN